MLEKLPIVGNNPGGIRDHDDERDYSYERIATATAVPAFDWEKGFDIEAEVGKIVAYGQFRLPVKDQNGSGSCGGQAWSSYGSVLEALHDKTFEERSAKFIYAHSVYPQPGGGSTGRDNCDVAIKKGFAREAVCPSYDNGQPPSEMFMTDIATITPEAFTDAAKDRAYSYANVNPKIDLIAQAISNNGGMCIGLDGQNNGTWLSPFPKPPAYREWGHWVYAGKAKLINGVKHIGFLNSWGKSVGEMGWQWLSLDWFTSNSVWPGWTFVWNLAPQFRHHFVFRLAKTDVLQNTGEIRALQIALFIDGKADGTFQDSDWKTVEQVMTFGGYFGDATEMNLKRFQAKYNLPMTGVTDDPTNAKLNALFNY